MHLGNSIICPVTGIPMIIAAGVAMFWAVKKAKEDFRKENILPAILMTIFVFALQMMNFAIPTTGSSGHIVGAILLSAILGPYVGFISICTILLVQSVFFADGGFVALGCNIFNMGVLACFVAYPFIYKPLAEKNRPILAAILSSVAALQLGSIAVVIESAISGSTIANVGLFASLMQSIHLAIGFVEGIFTAMIIAFANRTAMSKSFKYIIGFFAMIFAGFIYQYASVKPDGLEWSLLNMSDAFVAQTQGQLYFVSEMMQAKTSVLGSMSSGFANIIGLAIVGMVMFGISALLVNKTEKVTQ